MSENKTFKIYFSGYAIVTAETEEEAKELFFDDMEDMNNYDINSIEEM